MKKLWLAKPRGFCAGVTRALEIVEYALKLYPPPIFVRHEIVHNRYVVESLRNRGIIFVEEIYEIPEKCTVIFSAHGVSPQVWQEAHQRQLHIIDATCPLVTKVHNEAIRYSRMGYTILLIGHRKHVETQGTYGEAPSQIRIVENENEAASLKLTDVEKVCYLTQTTLSVGDTARIVAILKERFPSIQEPAQKDICYATTNRQNAVAALADRCDKILVVGSKNSSNSNRLKEIAVNKNCSAELIDSYEDLNESWLESINHLGITAGASAPENLVKELIQHLKRFGFSEIEEISTAEENIRFHLPKELELN